jgi:hypothetical protein
LAAENARLRRESERLRMEGELLKTAAHFLGSAEMKFRLIANQRETFPVHTLVNSIEIADVAILPLLYDATNARGTRRSCEARREAATDKTARSS